MSAEVREALAEAASTLEGINVTPYFRQSLRPGDGVVRLLNQNRAENGFGFIATWQVWIALSQDAASAEKWLDAHLSELVAALTPELHVTTITLAELASAGAAVPGVIIEGARKG